MGGPAGARARDPARGRRCLSTESVQLSGRGESDVWKHTNRWGSEAFTLLVSAKGLSMDPNARRGCWLPVMKRKGGK